MRNLRNHFFSWPGIIGPGLIHRASSAYCAPFIVYLRRILRALNLHKKIEYTARIAPAQLGKATVNR